VSAQCLPLRSVCASWPSNGTTPRPSCTVSARRSTSAAFRPKRPSPSFDRRGRHREGARRSKVGMRSRSAIVVTTTPI
jgi:hypothetical protein